VSPLDCILTPCIFHIALLLLLLLLLLLVVCVLIVHRPTMIPHLLGIRLIPVASFAPSSAPSPRGTR